MTRARVLYPADGVEFSRISSLDDNTAVAAITLLVINILFRRAIGHASESDFVAALQAHLPDLLAYSVTFLLVAVAWRAQHRLTSTLRAMDDAYIRANLLWVFVLALAPVAGIFVTDFPAAPLAVATYWGWLAAVWTADAIASTIAHRHGLVSSDHAHLHHAPPARLRGSVVRAILFAVAAVVSAVAGTIPSVGIVVPGLAVLWWLRFRAVRTGAEPVVDESA